MPDVQTPLGALPSLTDVQLSAWKDRLSAAREVTKELVEEGRALVKRVQAKTLKTKPLQHTVVVPLDYASVEQKKATLFQVPEMVAEGRRPEAEGAAPLFAAVANHVLGPEGVNAGAMLFEVQADVLIQGYAVTKIGYENVVDGVKPVPSGKKIPDPAFRPPPSVLGLSAPAPLVDEMVPAPNIISETYYWRRISPGFLLAPRDFLGSNFDDADWIAWRFSEPVPEGVATSYSSEKDDELLLVEPAHGDKKKTQKRCGTEVWYKASRLDPTEKHPDVIRTFKLYDDEPQERAHRMSPFQQWRVNGAPVAQRVPGAELGGMKGFPIHILTLRYLSDCAFPPSDVGMGAGMSDEISTGRTQLLRRRDRSLPQVLYDATRVDPLVLAKIESNENTGFIGVSGPPGEIFLPLDKGQFGRENFAFNEQAQLDYDKAWAHGTHGGTVAPEVSETATKSNQIQASIASRQQLERQRELEWFVAGATKLMSLYQLFADAQDYVPITGDDGVQRLAPWNKLAIPGPFILKPRPNSHIRLDPEQEFQQDLRFFNLAGNAPEGNRSYMLQRLATKNGMDPMRVLQQPPPKTPEAGKGSVTLKVEDFLGPGAPIAAAFAKHIGMEIPPDALQAASVFAQMWARMQAQAALQAQQAQGHPETEHGGAMEHGGMTDPINKHAQDLTGGMPGIGGPVS